ncbi:MAG TPA: GNAT family N-acetyltransferase [Phycisphaerae bacterium]|nr:GNAT family N-acetyltransferase [Phycisphaerae bacterium]
MAETLTHRPATLDDVPLLARMNQQLVEDEDHPHRHKGSAWIERRMRGFLESDYQAVVFEAESQPVAYALFRDEAPDRIYLRQFFVVRHLRRRGVGRRAIDILKKHIWPPDKNITVGVLCHNQPGLAFWRAVGFRDHCLNLRMRPHER